MGCNPTRNLFAAWLAVRLPFDFDFRVMITSIRSPICYFQLRHNWWYVSPSSVMFDLRHRRPVQLDSPRIQKQEASRFHACRMCKCEWLTPNCPCLDTIQNRSIFLFASRKALMQTRKNLLTLDGESVPPLFAGSGCCVCR